MDLKAGVYQLIVDTGNGKLVYFSFVKTSIEMIPLSYSFYFVNNIIPLLHIFEIFSAYRYILLKFNLVLLMSYLPFWPVWFALWPISAGFPRIEFLDIVKYFKMCTMAPYCTQKDYLSFQCNQ